MNKIRICLKINGMARDENGNPCPAGISMTLGETEKDIDYAELTANIKIDGVLKMACLDGFVDPKDIEIITPEEYDRDYGGDDD